MAPVTPSSGPSASQGPRSQQTVHVVGPMSTQNASTAGSSTQKLPTAGISSILSTHIPGSTNGQKKSPTAISASTAQNVGLISSSKPAVVGSSTWPSSPQRTPTTNSVGPTTTRRMPIVSALSPGGIHPNYSTYLPPLPQGQQGLATDGSDGANTSTIVAGVIVPLILIGVGALIVYIWYRRKYPVRMMLGRDFNRFSNPAYNKRASTLTLVRNDEIKQWETLTRRNPDLSVVNEDDPDGIENQAFESEKDEIHGDGTAEKIVEEVLVASSAEGNDIVGQPEMIQSIGISRERPKTKKAVLVKTSTMEDFENGFELVTESDLGQRTESEVSSGNDSTETHTISLTFSETFDDRHKEDQRHFDMSEENTKPVDVNDHEIDTSVEENGSSSSTTGEKVNNSESEHEDMVVSGCESGENDDIVENNESFEVLFDDPLGDISTEQEKQNRIENNATQYPPESVSKEDLIGVMSENISLVEELESFHMADKDDSDVSESADQLPVSKINELCQIGNDDAKQQETYERLKENDSTLTSDLHIESLNSCNRSEKTNAVKTEDNPDQVASGPINSVEVKTESVTSTLNNDECISNTTSTDINILEKEKTEILEKQNQLEANHNLEVVSPGDIECSHSDGTVDETDSQKTSLQRKKPSLHLSNENIVLDTVPQTPTVLVQESFILEIESPLPVHLDSTHFSPVRGRRAFTLNDIASKQNSDDDVGSEFSLPKEKTQISKSSPVITQNFKFDLENNRERELDCSKECAISNHSEYSTFATFQNDDEEIKSKDSHKTNKLFEYGSSGSSEHFKLDKNTHIPNDLHKDNDEMFKSLEQGSFELDLDKANESTLESAANSSDRHSNQTNSFHLISTDVNSSENLSHETSHSLQQDFIGEKPDKLNLFASEETFEGTSEPFETTYNAEATSGDNLDQNNPFFNDFPSSSTPTDSIVADATAGSDNDNDRKKVLPQVFDFENFSDTDTISSKSETSFETGDVEDKILQEEKDISTSSFDVENAGKANTAADYIEAKSSRENSFTTEDLFSSTLSTGSSTALSWEILSRENSVDSKNNDQFDIQNKVENAPERLNFVGINDMNNESKSLCEESSIVNLISDMSKQTALNDSSKSAETADVSWEILNEEGENSEC